MHNTPRLPPNSGCVHLLVEQGFEREQTGSGVPRMGLSLVEIVPEVWGRGGREQPPPHEGSRVRVVSVTHQPVEQLKAVDHYATLRVVQLVPDLPWP